MTDPATPTLDRPPIRILVLASYQYMNYGVVIAHLTSLLPAVFVIASQMGVGHSLLTRAGNHSLLVEPFRWQPTRPHMEVKVDAAVLFWDGHDKALLPSVVILKKHAVPMTIVDGDGNALDLAQFCATLTNGNGDKMATTAPAPTPAATPAPQVIVDAPSPNSRVIVKVSLPEATMAAYDAQAKQVKQSPEKVMSDRLRTCVDHTSGRGLYFNDEQRSHLERITGGHLLTDPTMALQSIKATVELKVGGITIELTDRVLSRCASRAKAERKTLEQYVTKEVIQGLEKSCGLRPY